ncbi:hypothetical protein TSAR_015542 [Trichomalopsis sarcophagae]|uniref:Uncharacterized protein n=1 Tax=Trichomalopsis sarcophagae TaxID=543379 RepID=A0A232EUA5_9HYME|nr:hypothetical protein TSAR_015542 [Trichomalopsis sarcophagae]
MSSNVKLYPLHPAQKPIAHHRETNGRREGRRIEPSGVRAPSSRPKPLVDRVSSRRYLTSESNNMSIRCVAITTLMENKEVTQQQTQANTSWHKPQVSAPTARDAVSTDNHQQENQTSVSCLSNRIIERLKI